MRKSVDDDVIARASAQYSKALEAMRSYVEPVGKPTDMRTIDRQVARMTPQDVLGLAQTNPAAAEQAAQRMEIIDARAATQPPFSDVQD